MRKKSLFGMVAIMFATIVGVAVMRRVGEVPAPKAALEVYLSSKAPDRWWLTNEFENHRDGDLIPPEVLKQLTQMNLQVGKVLDGNGETTPFSSEIIKSLSERFGRMLVAIHRGEHLTVLPPEGETITKERAETTIKMGYIPKQHIDVASEEAKSPINYNPNSRGVMIPAIEWPDIPLAASLFHELGHAYRHLVSGVPQDRPKRSESMALEEVEMHELGGALFDALTQRAYSAFLGRFLAREKISRPEQVVGRFTAKDLAELDTLLGLRHATQTPVRMALAQTFLSLGFLYIDQRVPAAERLKAKADFYLWYTEKPSGK